MRINELRRYANNQLHADKRGTTRDKKHRIFVINKVIHDLIKIGQVPAKWHALNLEHILSLICLWKKQKIKDVTLMKYMTVIRKFLQNIGHSIDAIDNQALRLTRTMKSKPHAVIPTDILEKLKHPIASVIFQFQTEFGLTFTETTLFIPDIHFSDQSLWLTREITSNSQDRIIPIRNENQHAVLQALIALTGSKHNLIIVYGYHAVLHIYRAAMQQANLNATQSYRYLYAKHQVKQLAPLFSHAEITQIMMHEMGLKSRSTLWSYLHE